MFCSIHDKKGQRRCFQAKLPHLVTKPLAMRVRGKVLYWGWEWELKITRELRTEITGMTEKQKIILGKSPSPKRTRVWVRNCWWRRNPGGTDQEHWWAPISTSAQTSRSTVSANFSWRNAPPTTEHVQKPIPPPWARWDRASPLLLLRVSVRPKSSLKIGTGLSYRKRKMFTLHTHVCGLGSFPATELLVSDLCHRHPFIPGALHLCSVAPKAITNKPWVLPAQGAISAWSFSR